VSVRFDPEQNLVVVPVRVSGPSGDLIVRLALDTGATRTMLDWEVVVLLGYDPGAVRERVRITTASGVEFVPRVTVEKIETLGEERLESPVLCHTLPPSAMLEGLLGMDFLRGCRLVLDFRSGVVALE
jgi:predicted aspartyl protease